MNSKYKPIIGTKYNSWEVISSQLFTYEKSNTAGFLVKCKCGTEKITPAYDLVKGKSKHCSSCKRYEGIDDFSKTLWSVIVKGARVRNMKLSITMEYAYKVLQDQSFKCALSGLDITLHKAYTLNREMQTASLDRIDSTKGYVEGNIQWLHKDVNIMKNKYSQEYFISICKAVAGSGCEVK